MQDRRNGKKAMRKLFFETKMGWGRVILLAVICGIIVGALMIPDALINTSLQQPGITFEFWILAALFIILNCKKPIEAGLKTFVFFLVSQPLIYLVQVPFQDLGWQLFSYYKRWFFFTLLTLPGGMLAWFVKKKNWLSVLLLSAANLIALLELPDALSTLTGSFPLKLLTVLFILAEIVFFTFLLLRDRKKRIATFVLTALLLGLFLCYTYFYANTERATFGAKLEGTPPYTVVNECDGLEISFEEDGYMRIVAEYYVDYDIELLDADGNEITVHFLYNEEGASVTAE